jgi:P27 family predicted phage terminase small subunit
MAPRGPKPKPTALKQQSGNPGHRKPNKSEPVLAPSLPQPPEHLTEAAVEEWNRVAPELYKARVLTDADRMGLAAYCQAYADWVNARGEIEISGYVITTEKGNVIQSPWVGIANRAMANFMRIAAEFGMTPSSRTRVSAPSSDPKKKLDKFRGKTS